MIGIILLLAQAFVPQTEIEMIKAELYLPPVYDKAPIDAELEDTTPMRIVDADQVRADRFANFATSPEKGQMIFSRRPPLALLTNFQQTAPTITFTASPQGAVANGVFSWVADACNNSYTESWTGDADMLLQVVDQHNIPRQSVGEAEAQYDSARNKTKTIQGASILSELGQYALIIGPAGVITMSLKAVASLALGTKVLTETARYLQRQAPPTFQKRYPYNYLLIPGPLNIAPRTCYGEHTFFSKRMPNKDVHTISAQVQ